MHDDNIDDELIDEPRPRVTTALIVIIGFVIACVIGGVVGWKANDYFTKPSLVEAVQGAGWQNITYYPANKEVGTQASVTVMYGTCLLRLTEGVRTDKDGAKVAALVLIENDGGRRYDVSPAELDTVTVYDPCRGVVQQ